MGIFSKIKSMVSGNNGDHDKQIDVNKPVSNPGLKKAISAFYAEKTEANLQLFVNELKSATFLMVIMNDGLKFTPTDSAGVGVFEKGSKINFYMLTDSNGNSFHPLFTDWHEIDLWFESREGISGLISPALDTFRFIQSDAKVTGLVINPASDNWTMTQQQIQTFLTENQA